MPVLSAEFSRRLAQVKETPYWRYIFATTEDLRRYSEFQSAVINAAVDAGNFDGMPQQIREIILLAEKSVQVAQKLGFDPPYSLYPLEDLEKINDALKADQARQGTTIDVSKLLA